MGVFNHLQGSLYIMQLLIIKLVCCLGWLSSIAVAQLEISESITGSANFPQFAIACAGNFAVFITSLSRGRLDLEIGAKDVLATLTGPKLQNISGFGLTTCRDGLQSASVVMLSTSTISASVRQFMKYMSNAHHVDSIMLQCVPLNSLPVTEEICECNEVTCGCIAFWTVEEITIMLAGQMPGILKPLSGSLCLLPSLNCLRNGCHGCNQECHGCNQGMLYVETDEFGREILTMGDSKESDLVCETLESFQEFTQDAESVCICIPVHAADQDDEWTELLNRSFLMLKEEQMRGVKVIVTELGLAAGNVERAEYNTTSLTVPRFVEALVNILLTGWFKVDGFSSSLVARRALRKYLLNTNGTGFAANAFLTKALVKYNVAEARVCQLLAFRGNPSIKALSFLVGCVNLICSIGWAVLIACEGSAVKGYYTQSMAPSKARVVALMAALGIALVMDLLTVWERISNIKRLMLWVVIFVEVGIILCCSLEIRNSSIKGLGRWVYSVIHALVWVKWGMGSYILGEYSSEFDSKRGSWGPDGTIIESKLDSGTLVYASAFLINAILTGVQGEWKYDNTN